MSEMFVLSERSMIKFMMMLSYILQETSKLFRSSQILWCNVLYCWHDLQILQYFLMFLFINDQLKIHWTSFKHRRESRCSARKLSWCHLIISALNLFCAETWMNSQNIMMSFVIFFNQLIMKTLKSISVSRMLEFLFFINSCTVMMRWFVFCCLQISWVRLLKSSLQS